MFKELVLLIFIVVEHNYFCNQKIFFSTLQKFVVVGLSVA